MQDAHACSLSHTPPEHKCYTYNVLNIEIRFLRLKNCTHDFRITFNTLIKCMLLFLVRRLRGHSAPSDVRKELHDSVLSPTKEAILPPALQVT